MSRAWVAAGGGEFCIERERGATGGGGLSRILRARRGMRKLHAAPSSRCRLNAGEWFAIGAKRGRGGVQAGNTQSH